MASGADTASQRDTGRLLGQPPFRRFWLARVLSQTAQAAILYGLLVLIVDLTSSGVWTSVFVLCSIIPSLLFGLPGGWFADWMPKRLLMAVSNLGRAVLMGLLIWWDYSLGLIFAVTLGIWTIHQFYSPAESALLGALVPVRNLASATSAYNFALLIAQLLGLVILAPLMLKYAIPEALFAVCAILFLTSIILVLRIGGVPTHHIREHGSAEAEISGVFRSGWRAISHDRRAIGALVNSVLIGIGLSALIVIVPQFLNQVLETSADNTVFVFAPAALGLVVGLLVAPVAGRIIGFGRIATLGFVLFALSIAALGLLDQFVDFFEQTGFAVGWLQDAFGIPPAISTTMILSIPAGFATALVNVAARSEMQSATPPNSWARVFATQSTLANLGALVPTLLVGVLIDLVGVPSVALLIAAGLLCGRLLAGRIGPPPSYVPGISSP